MRKDFIWPLSKGTMNSVIGAYKVFARRGASNMKERTWTLSRRKEDLRRGRDCSPLASKTKPLSYERDSHSTDVRGGEGGT